MDKEQLIKNMEIQQKDIIENLRMLMKRYDDFFKEYGVSVEDYVDVEKAEEEFAETLQSLKKALGVEDEEKNK